MVDSVYKRLYLEVKSTKFAVENKRLTCAKQVLKTGLVRIKYTLIK